jgi:prepilin-type N-terminal cleavage/methylation domain-containing protein
MNDPIPSTESKSRGFTLTELLVTMTISASLLLILSAIVTQTTDGYAFTQRSINHLSQARAFLQLFESELSLRLPETPIVHLSSFASGPVSSDQIAFARTRPLDERNPEIPGDLTTSCYYVAFVEDSDQRTIPKLFRKILNPIEAQAFIDDGREAVLPDIDPTVDEPVIDSVLSFHAVPMYRNPETANDEPWDQTTGQPPSHIELTIRTLDESFSRRFTDKAAWNRLAISPTESERSMIRSVTQKVSIGK